ncbi:hypothetical protein PT974_04233 [Cladobotryum mycophilum]|uniref:Uncharacterized protein n=1 Tax=Cladobotryum mycophilum TaxID=491253 RepID=A0ABR0SUF1_9HYPO
MPGSRTPQEPGSSLPDSNSTGTCTSLQKGGVVELDLSGAADQEAFQMVATLAAQHPPASNDFLHHNHSVTNDPPMV